MIRMKRRMDVEKNLACARHLRIREPLVEFDDRFGGVGLEVFELQLHLVEQATAALGAPPLLDPSFHTKDLTAHLPKSFTIRRPLLRPRPSARPMELLLLFPRLRSVPASAWCPIQPTNPLVYAVIVEPGKRALPQTALCAKPLKKWCCR